MLFAATPQRLALELGSVVQEQLGRLAAHRPAGLHSQPLKPSPLVRHHVRQAQPDRQRRGRFQRDDQAYDAPAEHVDRHSYVRPADRQPVPLVDDDQIDHGVVDLDLLQHGGHRRGRTTGRLQRPRGVRPFPRGHLLDRVQLGDSPRERPPRWHPPAAATADSRQLPVHCGRRPFLPSQIPGPKEIADQRLDLVRQLLVPPAAAGPPRDQVRDDTFAFPPAAQQQVHLPP
jgi:hypothetical protein